MSENDYPYPATEAAHERTVALLESLMTFIRELQAENSRLRAMLQARGVPR